MGAPVLKSLPSPYEEKIWGYLSGYWMEEDQWDLSSAAFTENGIDTAGLEGILADFSSYRSFTLKNEMKYYLLHELKEEILSVRNIYMRITGRTSGGSGTNRQVKALMAPSVWIWE